MNEPTVTYEKYIQVLKKINKLKHIQKTYYEKNKTKIKQKQKAYYEKNKDKFKQKYQHNKELIREKYLKKKATQTQQTIDN